MSPFFPTPRENCSIGRKCVGIIATCTCSCYSSSPATGNYLGPCPSRLQSINFSQRMSCSSDQCSADCCCHLTSRTLICFCAEMTADVAWHQVYVRCDAVPVKVVKSAQPPLLINILCFGDLLSKLFRALCNNVFFIHGKL